MATGRRRLNLPMSDAARAIRVERTQSLSHADLRRLLPRVLAGATLCWAGTSCAARFPDGRLLELALAPEIERRLGSLRIVSTPLQFCFHAWAQDTVAAFMVQFERALQQGGG